MNRNARSFRSKFDNAVQTAKNIGTKVAGTAIVATASLPAFAGGGGGVDTSSIESKMDEYGAAAVALAIAFAVILWGLRASGLLKPRG